MKKVYEIKLSWDFPNVTPVTREGMVIAIARNLEDACKKSIDYKAPHLSDGYKNLIVIEAKIIASIDID